MMKRILSSVLVICLLINTLFAFSISVSASSTPSVWAVDEVNKAIANDLTTAAVTADYQKAITREEFCELVVKLYEKITGSSIDAVDDPFTDTNNPEVLKAYLLSLVKGVANDKFAPTNKITRQEICVMLARCIDISIPAADINDFVPNTFDDGSTIADWAVDSVNYAYTNNIIKGVGNNKFDPLGNTTCEQAILLVYRIYSAYASFNVTYKVKEENIAKDPESEITYVNNIVIIIFKDSASFADKNNAVKSINGTVVGQIDTLNQYQVQVETTTLNALLDICNEIKKFDFVQTATYDIATEISTNSVIPNDKWENDTWNETAPNGNNWWLEAIQAPSAWNYNYRLDNIKIGIIDYGFDNNHEDLKDKIIFATKENEILNSKDDHGTHVAGIIGASADNNLGITGIVWNSDLICYDWSPTDTQTWNTASEIAAGLANTVAAGAKVVNFSFGCTGSLPKHTNKFSQKWIDEQGRQASLYMAELLSKGYDFIVVQSAGAGAKDKIGVDAVNNGWFSSITKDNCYNELVDVNEILNRVIIVGSAEPYNGSYKQSVYSNGGSQVDICAPGANIYSSIADNKYDYKSGPSMSASMVSGVAALVWSANSTLNGDDVKKIVCDPNNTSHNVIDNEQSPNAVGNYRMVNAKLALDAAFNKLSLGSGHSAVITNDNDLWMWGNNYQGCLGNGSQNDSLTPLKVMNDVKSISLGDNHTAALKSDGSLWMWGDNTVGQLGNGSTTASNSPIRIMNDVSFVSLGAKHSAAIKKDGTLWLWGGNDVGEIGNGTDIPVSMPVKIMSDVNSVSLGGNHSAAIKNDGSLWMWGNNFKGSLGNGTTDDAYTPIKIMDNVSAVSLGYAHSAAIKDDGSLWLWGHNANGAIGNGTKTDVINPVKIMDDVKAVSLGMSTSFALKNDNTLWAWGENNYGGLGNNTTSSTTPVMIMENVVELSAGFYHVAALKEDGTIWMWGNNYKGSVGDGTTNNVSIPKEIISVK